MKTYKNRLVKALASELFEEGGYVKDLEYLYLVKTGRDGI